MQSSPDAGRQRDLGVIPIEELLRHTRERYRVLVQTVPHGIQENDSKGRITFANRAQHRILGYDEGELVGKFIWDLIDDPTDRNILPAYLRILVRDQPRPTPFFAKNRRKDGVVIDVQVDWTYVTNPAGEVEGFVSIITDVTERMRMEKDLRRATAAAQAASTAKSVFLRNMSHELRTPLNGVIGMAHLLRDTELSDRQEQFVDKILRSSDRLLTVLSDLLEFSALKFGTVEAKLEVIDFRLLVEEVMTSFRDSVQGRGPRLVSTVENGVPQTGVGDLARLRQVLAKLVGNAIKFTDHGEVSLRVAVDGESAGAGKLRFEIRDSGIGIPDEALDTVFDEFSQVDDSLSREHGGLGLGLGICRQLVELMGGEIGIESKPHAGTVLWFVLPIK